ncbi:MAG: DUF2062 domain-containing protein [Nitrospirae bacterium]|nr:DUF2062 domain-containing protein [Nitrospirota bacterium]
MSIKDNIRYILTVKGTPRSIAASFAIGVFIGMSPFLGLHTIMALVVANILGLNRMVTLAGAYLTNPWTIVPIYSFCTWFGVKITGYGDRVPEINFHEITVFNIVNVLKSLLVPFFVGTTVVGLVAAGVSYFAIHSAINRLRK